MFKFSLRLALISLVLVLALGAVAVNLARVYVHSLEDGWDELVAAARVHAGASLAAEVETDGFQWHPRIVLRNLHITAPSGIFSSAYIELRVNLLRSLWTRSLSLSHVVVRGCQLNLALAPSASAASKQSAWGVGELLRRLHITNHELRDCRLHVEQEGGAQLRISIEQALNAPLGPLSWHSSLRGSIAMQFGSGDAAPSLHAPALHVYLRSGRAGPFWHRITTRAAAFNSPQLTLRSGEAEMAASAVEGTVDGFSSGRDTWRGSLRALRFDYLGRSVRVPDIPVAWPNADLYSMYIDNLDLGTLAASLSDSGMAEALGWSALKQLQIGGTVSKLRLSLSRSRPGKPLLPEISMRFKGLQAVPLIAGVPGFAGVSGELLAVPGLIRAQLEGSQLEGLQLEGSQLAGRSLEGMQLALWVPAVYGTVLPYREFDAKVHINFYEDAAVVEIPSAQLHMSQGDGVATVSNLQLRLSNTGELDSVSGQANIRELEFIELINHMPIAAFDEVMPEWFATGTSAGVLRELSVDMALDKPGDILDVSNRIRVTGHYDNWDLMIIRGLIFDNISGVIDFDGVLGAVTMNYDAAEIFRAPMPSGLGVLRTTESSWTLSIEAPYARAVFSQRYGDAQVYGHCEFVRLPNLLAIAQSTLPSVTTTAMRTFRPSRLPESTDTVWVPVTVDSFHMGKYDLGVWRFDVYAGVRRMLVENMYADKAGITLRSSAADGTGAKMVQWLDEDGWTTLFEGGLEIPDMGELFTQLGVAPVVTGKDGHLLATLSWPGELADFDLQTLRGDIRFELGRGEFPDVERPGILKVIGLLSFSNILRGVLPSLRSLESHGLRFQEVQARAFMADGRLHFDPDYGTTVGANEGKFVLRGEADLVAGTVDGELDVTLYLADNLPLMALIAVGSVPLLFAGTWLASKIVGSGVNRLAHVVYTIKGPWADLELGKRQAEPPPAETAAVLSEQAADAELTEP